MVKTKRAQILIVLTTLILLSVALFSPRTSYAECGDFILESGIYEGELYEERVAIDDCDNPFNEKTPKPFTAILELNGQNVTEDTVVIVTPDESISGTFSIEDSELGDVLAFELLDIYQVDGEDYRLVYDTRSNDFTLPPLSEGDYVAVVIHEAAPILSYSESFWQQIVNKIFGVELALAYEIYPDFRKTVAIPFSIEHEEIEPAGASSILFLPGIQASKLYMPGGLVSGFDTVWPPDEIFNLDVRNLRMNESGESVEDISTHDVVRSVPGLGSIYGGFLNFLSDQIEAEFPIADYVAFPYDWRYDVLSVATEDVKYRDNTLKTLLDEINRLADDSYTGKVTIIAHSNGGLVTKAFMSEYQDDLEDKVDRIIFIGSPLLGTPKAIGAMLHGYDETSGFTGTFKHGTVVREVINNMPGAYGLLPSEAYFDAINEPMIIFDNSATTEEYRNRYGSEISSYDTYLDFLKGDDELDRTISDNLAIPVRLNANMVDSSSALHDSVLDDWVAPESVEVIEIVGTGLPTMKSVEYRELIEKKCVLGLFSCEDVVEMKPYASLTKYGDGTVTQFSAESYLTDSTTYYLNLKQIEEDLPNEEFEHANLTEQQSVQMLIASVLKNTSENHSFITVQSPDFDDPYDIELMDSPVRMLATDSSGRKTGIEIENGEEVLRLEIPNSDYFEFGETKYLVMPSDTDRVTELFGEDYGGYTLTVAVLNESDEQAIISQLKNATVTPSMVARYEKQNGEYSTLITDLEGDGVFETEVLLDGTIVSEPPVMISYDSLISTVKSFELSRVKERLLLGFIKSAESASKKKSRIAKKLEVVFLRLAEKTVKQYKRKGYLNTEEADGMIELIVSLRKNL